MKSRVESPPPRALEQLSPAAFAATLIAGSLALVLFACHDALHAWFAADDFLWLEISTFDDVLRSFVGPWGHGAAWRPLSRVSFYLDYRLFGLAAGPWHLDSLLWHAAGTTLFALLLDRTCNERTFAVAAAAIFALLPMHYENTMWISARSHLLAFTGTLGTLLVFARFLATPSWARLLGCAALLSMSLLAYEAAVYTLPLAMLVVLARQRPIAWRPAAAGLGTLSVVILTYLLLRRWVLAGESLYQIPPPSRYLTIAFVAHLGRIAGSLLAQISPSPWWFAGAALVSALVAPRMLTIAGFGVAVMMIGYAPFAVVDGFGPRFAYATQAGLAMTIAAVLVGLSRLRWLGRPCAAVLLVVLLAHELRETRQIASEWRAAGNLGQLALTRLVEAWRDPDPAHPAVILGAPTGHGHALVFFTYFDLALGTFHPRYAGLRVPGHILTDFTPQLSRALLTDAWRREQARRQRRGLPEFVCAPGDPERARDVDGFLRALLDCGAVFYSIDPKLTVRKLPRHVVAARIERGWRTPPD